MVQSKDPARHNAHKAKRPQGKSKQGLTAECLLDVKYLLICSIIRSAEFKEKEENLSDVCIHLCVLKCVC